MDIHRSAFSLVIHKNGNVTQNDIDNLLDYHRSQKGLTIKAWDYIKAVDLAKKRYNEKNKCLFICTDLSCKKAAKADLFQAAKKELSNKPCTIEKTGCHWHCSNAPVMTLKVKDKVHSFLECSLEHTSESVFDSIRNLIK